MIGGGGGGGGGGGNGAGATGVGGTCLSAIGVGASIDTGPVVSNCGSSGKAVDNTCAARSMRVIVDLRTNLMKVIVIERLRVSREAGKKNHNEDEMFVDQKTRS